tara:strand:+ start:161 stop:319 length:159 start_codon:yes stop_codon:yes gene_type:complete
VVLDKQTSITAILLCALSMNKVKEKHFSMVKKQINVKIALPEKGFFKLQIKR